MEIIKGEREELEKKVIALLKEKVELKLKKKKKVVLGIPGGSSVKGVFEKLRVANLSWEDIEIFMVDERFVPLTNENSNFGQAEKLFIGDLFRKGKIPEENVHAFSFNSDKEESVKEYEEEFFDGREKFDVVILGLGEDGHVASLFPKSDVLSEYCGFIFIENSPKKPKERISASRKLLEKTDFAILLVFGEGKKKAYERFLDKEIKVDDCPAKMLENVEELFVFSDLG